MIEPQIVAMGLLAATVLVSMLGIGAVHLPLLLVSSALGFAAAAVALRQQALGRDGLVLPVPALVCAALAVYTVFQSIPLPMRVLEVLSPHAADVWQRSLLPLGQHGPSWAPLSLDPGASRVEALRWTTYAAVFCAASSVSASHGAEWGLRIVFGSALVAALATLGHGLLGATRVYGIYLPLSRPLAWHVAPLLNPNNLAGYLNLGALTGLGLMLGNRPGLPRWLFGIAVATIAGVAFTTASRAGVASLILGVAMLALFAKRRRRSPESAPSASSYLLLGVLVIGAAFALLGGNQKVLNELLDKDLSKLTMALWVKPMVREFPIFGVGRGAFESAFPVYRTTPGGALYAHAENFVVQWVAEWGLPVSIVALAVFVWAFLPQRVGAFRSMTAAGAWCGVVALLAQNLLDLALEVPGVVIALAAVLGALWGDRHRARAGDAVRVAGPLPLGRANLAAAGVGAVGLLLSVSALASGTHDVEADRRAARDLATGPHEDPAHVRSVLRDAMIRHPAEPFFSLLGAMVAFRTQDESPIPWLQRSLERAGVNGWAHLLLAQVLDARGARGQALLEVRLAVEDEGNLAGSGAQVALHVTRSFDKLLLAVPEGKEGTDMISSLAQRLRAPGARPEDFALGRQLDLEALRRNPDLIPPRVREADERIAALIAMGDANAPAATAATGAVASICADRVRCHDEVTAQVKAILRLAPKAAVGPILRARLLMAENRPDEALHSLDGLCVTVDEVAWCHATRATAAGRIKDPALLDAASKEMFAATCTTPHACADTATFLANIRSERNEPGTALALLARAAREDPSEDSHWLQLANAAAAAGSHGEALNALERLQRKRGGNDSALAARIEAERAALSDRIYLHPH